MSFILSHEGYFFFAWLALIFFLEQIKQRFFVPTHIEDGGLVRWSKNAIFGMINRLLAPILMLPIVVWASTLNLWHRPEWLSGVPALIIDVVVLDLSTYWFHRFSHRVPFLWRFHEIHHLDSAFDTTTGLRIHFGELVLQNVFRAAPIIALSIPLRSALIFETILLMGGLFHHSNFCIPEKLEQFLSYFIVTPNRHCVHHHAVIKDTDSKLVFLIFLRVI